MGQSVLETKILLDTVSWWCENSRTPDLEKTKSTGNKTWQAENKIWKVWVHVTDNESWNSCCRVVCNHESTFSSAVKPTKHNVLWPCTIRGRLLLPKHGVPAVWMHLSTPLSFALTWGLNSVEKQLQACHGIIKTMGHETPELFSIGPGSWWWLEQLVFRDFSQSKTEMCMAGWVTAEGFIHKCRKGDSWTGFS